jgi:hypothetical protein
VKKAKEFDDRESLAVLVNHLLAIIVDEDKARVVVESPTRNGFSPDEIGILTATPDRPRDVLDELARLAP